MDTETKTAFGKIETNFGKIETNFGKIGKKFEKSEQRMEKLELGFEKLGQEMRGGFKEMRQEMKGGFKSMMDFIVFETSHLKRQMDERFGETNQRIDVLYEHVDGFINLHKTLDMELAATRLQHGRLEERVTKLEAKA